MEHEKIMLLLKEASKAGKDRAEEILNELTSAMLNNSQKSTVDESVYTKYIISLSELLFRSTFLNQPELLPGLYPFYSLTSGDRSINELPDIDWYIAKQLM